MISRAALSGLNWSSILWRSMEPNGWTVSSESTKNRYPRGVGILPAEVCGLAIKPISSRSAMIFRMLAGLSSKPEDLANSLEPIG